jgi:hypothetical protein
MYTHTHTYIHSFIHLYIHTSSLSDEVDHSEKKAAAAGRVGFGDEVPGGGGAKAATGSTREAEEEEEEAAGPGALIPMVDVSDVKVFVMSASFFSFFIFSFFPPFSFVPFFFPVSCSPWILCSAFYSKLN